MVSSFLGFTKDEVTKEVYSQNRFQYQYTIGSSITLRLCGPILKNGYKSCSIELKGEGCREFENASIDKTWIDFLEFFMVRLNASPSRVDITIDDYDGKDVTFDYIKRKLDLGLYNTSFKDKDFIVHGSAKKGLSIQLGNHSSTQMLVIYEKNKEQISKRKDCFQKYWVRFEMRYFKDKAYDVSMNILNQNELDFRKYVLGLLYQMLDLKEENNYNIGDQDKVLTDSNWSNFLECVSKAKMERYKMRKSTRETFQKFTLKFAMMFYLDLLLHTGNDKESTYTEFLKMFVAFLDNFDNQKLKKINNYLQESGLEKTDLMKIEEIIQDYKNIIDVRELPF